ncbi:unnamed protein product [Discosporangium mesarthrocarpum]
MADYGSLFPPLWLTFIIASAIKLLLLAPGLYHSTDFEVHRNWLAVTHSLPLKEWYWDETSEWTLDYPPFFAWFQASCLLCATMRRWGLSQVAVFVDADLVNVVPIYEPSQAAVIFQRVSVVATDLTLVLGVAMWSYKARKRSNMLQLAKASEADTSVEVTSSQHQDEGGGVLPKGGADYGRPDHRKVGALVLLSSGLLVVDHIHFQYNGFLLGLLLFSMGLIKHEREVLGGMVFAALLMLKHLFLALAPLYFIYLLRKYCYMGSGGYMGSGSYIGRHTGSPGGGPMAGAREHGGFFPSLLWRRLLALGSVVLAVFALALVPLCLSGSGGGGEGDPWGATDMGSAADRCRTQLGQIAVRLFPFGRGLVHAYWAPNLWALYLATDRVLLLIMKRTGMLDPLACMGSTTGGLVQTATTAVLPNVSPLVCVVLSLLACLPSLIRAWICPNPKGFAWGVVQCSLSSFLVGFHVHEKAILIPTIALALLVLESRRAAKLYIRLCYIGGLALFPLLPGPELMCLKVLLLITYMVMANAILQSTFQTNGGKKDEDVDVATPRGKSPPLTSPGKSLGILTGGDPQVIFRLFTQWDVTFLSVGVITFLVGEVVYPLVFGGKDAGPLPFLPLLVVSVQCALGVVWCWYQASVAVWMDG